MPAPTVEDVATYLGYDLELPNNWEWKAPVLTAALAAEKAAQASLCDVPADADPWPADLSEALCRRVAANLAVRRQPLGVQAQFSEFGVSVARVGGGDREVQRLEAPYRSIAIA